MPGQKKNHTNSISFFSQENHNRFLPLSGVSRMRQHSLYLVDAEKNAAKKARDAEILSKVMRENAAKLAAATRAQFSSQIAASTLPNTSFFASIGLCAAATAEQQDAKAFLANTERLLREEKLPPTEKLPTHNTVCFFPALRTVGNKTAPAPRPIAAAAPTRK